MIGAEDGKKTYVRTWISNLWVPGVSDTPGILLQDQPNRIEIKIVKQCM